VRLQSGDPVKGCIRADELTRTYVPWLTNPARDGDQHAGYIRTGTYGEPLAHPY
jgi:hypothetical protein